MAKIAPPKSVLDPNWQLRPFTDREKPIALFHEMREKIAKDAQNVLVYYGIGGIGKSSLSKELGNILNNNFTDVGDEVLHGRVDFASFENRRLYQALLVMRRDLRKIPFTMFNLAFAIYWKKQYPHLELPQKDFPFIENGDLANDVLQNINEIPILSTITKVTKAAFKAGTAFQKYWKQRGEVALQRLINLTSDEIEHELPAFWALDIQHYLAKNPKKQVVLFLDTYEALWGNLKREPSNEERIDQWIRDWITQTEQVLWVIFSRDHLDWASIDEAWEEIIHSKKIEEFTEIDTKFHLTKCEITDEAIQERLWQASLGIPFYLDLSIDTYEGIARTRTPKPDDFAETPKKVIDRFLIHLSSQANDEVRYARDAENLLCLLALPNQFDAEIYEILVKQLPTYEKPLSFAELCRYSFVKAIDGRYYALHNLMREALPKRLDESQRKAAHEALFAHYDAFLETKTIHDLRPEHNFAFVQALYHAQKCRDLEEIHEWFHPHWLFLNQQTRWQELLGISETFLTYLRSQNNPEKLAFFQNNVGNLYGALQQFGKAESSYLEALAIRRKLAEANPDAFLSDVAIVQNNLGNLYSVLQQFEKAEDAYKEALDIRRKLAEVNSNAFLLDVATTQNNLGELYRVLQQYGKARDAYKEALEIRRKLAEANPDAFLSYVATTQNNLGALYSDIQQPQMTEPALLEALGIRRKLAEVNPDAFNIVLGTTLVNMALFYTYAQPHPEKAVKYAQEALEVVSRYTEIVPRAKLITEKANAVLARWEA